MPVDAGEREIRRGLPWRTGGRVTTVTIGVSCVCELTEKWQNHERVGLKARAITNLLRLGQVDLGSNHVPRIQIERRKAIVAGKKELRFADPLGEP
jgi:hypothetical protein